MLDIWYLFSATSPRNHASYILPPTRVTIILVFDLLWLFSDVDHVFQLAYPTLPGGGQVPGRLRRLLDVLDGCAFTLWDNVWAEPPESIVDKGTKSIRGYFEDLYSEPCRIQHNSVKIILVGQEGAGKTR